MLSSISRKSKMKACLTPKILVLLIQLFLQPKGLSPSLKLVVATVVWSDTFTYMITPTDCQCDRWVEFWTKWMGDPTAVQQITLESSNGPGLNYTCSGYGAVGIAQKMSQQRLGLETFYCIESGTWYLGDQPTSARPGTVHMTVGGAPNNCDTYPTLRPCQTDLNWGNIGGGSSSCWAPNQTFTVTVVTFDTPVISPDPSPMCNITVPYGTVSGSFLTQCRYTVTCMSHYYLAGTRMQNGNFTCASLTTWNPYKPTCLPSCPPLIVASGVKVVYTFPALPTNEYLVGMSALLSCIDPTIPLVGRNVTICQSNNTWTTTNATCTATCAPLASTTYIVAVITAPMMPTGRYSVGTVAQLHCANPKWTLVGSGNSVCQNDKSWQPTSVCQAINFCQPNPCRNGGKCELSSKTNFTCACVRQWEGQICDKFGWPKDPLGIVALASQTVGCTTVVTLLSLTVVAYLVARDFSPQLLMILLSDFCALIAHLLVLFCRSPFLANLTVLNCKFVAFTIQFCLLASWNFLLLQNCQAFAITFGVVTKGYWPLIKAWQVVLCGFGLPTFLLTISFSINFDQFVTPWTCLVNYGNLSNRIFILSATAMGSFILILAESVGTLERNERGKTGKAAKLLLAVDRVQLVTGRLGLRSTVVVFLLSFTSFLLASMALYNVDSYLFPSAFITHIACGIVTFVLHCVEHPKVWLIISRWAKLICPYCLSKKGGKTTEIVELGKTDKAKEVEKSTEIVELGQSVGTKEFDKSTEMIDLGKAEIKLPDTQNKSYQKLPQIPEFSNYPPRF